jgi:hypothetical protein
MRYDEDTVDDDGKVFGRLLVAAVAALVLSASPTLYELAVVVKNGDTAERWRMHFCDDEPETCKDGYGIPYRRPADGRH